MSGAAGIGQLIADLVKIHAVAEPRNHRVRGGDAGKIERHDQPVLGNDLGWLHVTSHHALGNVDQLPHQRLQRIDIGGMFQVIHIVISVLRK